MSSWPKRQKELVNILPGHRLVYSVGHKLIVNLCLSWSTKNSPIRIRHLCHCMSFWATLLLTMKARSFSSSHVLFGQHCTHQSGQYVPDWCIWNIWSFRSTGVLTNKEIFCKSVIVFLRHHSLNREDNSKLEPKDGKKCKSINTVKPSV